MVVFWLLRQTISQFLILIEVLFFRFFKDDRNFSILYGGTFGSISRSAIASSIDLYSFTFASSTFFFMIKRGADLESFFVNRFISIYDFYNSHFVAYIYDPTYLECSATTIENKPAVYIIKLTVGIGKRTVGSNDSRYAECHSEKQSDAPITSTSRVFDRQAGNLPFSHRNKNESLRSEQQWIILFFRCF